MEPGFHSSISYKNEVYYPKLKNTSRRDKYLLYILGGLITKCHPERQRRMTKLDLSVDEKLSPTSACSKPLHVCKGRKQAFLVVGKGGGASLLFMPSSNHTHRLAGVCDKSARECPAPCPCGTARWRGPRCVRYAFHVRRIRQGRPLPPGRPS